MEAERWPGTCLVISVNGSLNTKTANKLVREYGKIKFLLFLIDSYWCVYVTLLNSWVFFYYFLEQIRISFTNCWSVYNNYHPVNYDYYVYMCSQVYLKTLLKHKFRWFCFVECYCIYTVTISTSHIYMYMYFHLHSKYLLVKMNPKNRNIYNIRCQLFIKQAYFCTVSLKERHFNKH